MVNGLTASVRPSQQRPLRFVRLVSDIDLFNAETRPQIARPWHGTTLHPAQIKHLSLTVYVNEVYPPSHSYYCMLLTNSRH
jgi:hypothetical protein